MRRVLLISALLLSVMALITVMPSSSMAWYGGYGSGCGYYGYPAYYGGFGWGYYGYPAYYGGYYGHRGWYRFGYGRHWGRGHYGRYGYHGRRR